MLLDHTNSARISSWKPESTGVQPNYRHKFGFRDKPTNRGDSSPRPDLKHLSGRLWVSDNKKGQHQNPGGVQLEMGLTGGGGGSRPISRSLSVLRAPKPFSRRRGRLSGTCRRARSNKKVYPTRARAAATFMSRWASSAGLAGQSWLPWAGHLLLIGRRSIPYP